MTKQLIINYSTFEHRVALIENGQVSEYYIERQSEKGIVGGIYKGKVIRVLPGIQSAFVDIGLDRAAFLYGGDIQTDPNSLPPDLNLEDGSKPAQFDPQVDADSTAEKRFNMNISELVKEGQELVLQVAKDAIGTKGARVTTFLSFPGRYVVLMPNVVHLGVSKKIGREEERNRLKSIVQSMLPAQMGMVVRTASDGVDEDKLRADISFVLQMAQTVALTSKTAPTPSLIHEDLNLVFRITRDLLSRDLERVIIDDRTGYDYLVQFLNKFSVKLGSKVQLYQGEVSIFDAYGVEVEVARALQPKVWLKSGGYLIVEQTEALTAIDVNTGKFVGGKSLGETILKTNLEAVREIVLQLRLRNIGGIVILDFIDMEKQEDRDKVFYTLIEELKKDKAKTSALRISELGLVQMTRKRTEESLAQKINVICPHCNGKGEIKSATTIAYDVVRELIREFNRNKSEFFLIKAHPSVTDRLQEEDAVFMREITQKWQRKILFKPMESFHEEHFELSSLRN
jgi:ribonuclease G